MGAKYGSESSRSTKTMEDEEGEEKEDAMSLAVVRAEANEWENIMWCWGMPRAMMRGMDASVHMV